MNRRELIKAFAATAPLTVAGRVWAAPATDARLLVVFLRGAYDAANVVVPVASDFYYRVPADPRDRPARRRQSQRGAVARRRLGPASGAAGQHLSAVGQEQIAFVPFAGTGRPDAAAISRPRTPSSSARPSAARATTVPAS